MNQPQRIVILGGGFAGTKSVSTTSNAPGARVRPGHSGLFFNWYECVRRRAVERKVVLRSLALEASAVRCRNLGRDDFPRHVSQQGVSGPFISGAGR